MNSMDSDIRLPSRTGRQVIMILGVALVAFSVAFAVSLLPFVASAHDADFSGHGTVSTTPGATVHVNLAVNLDAGDSVAAVSYWFDSSAPTCVAIDGTNNGLNPVTNTSSGHISGMSTDGFDVVAPNDTTDTTHNLFYKVSASSDCTSGVGSTQPDSNSNKQHLHVKVVVPPVVAPTLKVTTVVSGGTAQPGDFAIFVDGNAVTSGTAITSTVGAHVVTETASSTYATTFSGDCDTSGNVSLASGNAKACTVTNTYIPPVAVDCSTGIGSPLLVDVTQKITNDPDSSVSGPNWAVDNFTRHIQVWAEGSHYCAQADDVGTFTTNGTITPQAGTPLTETITGTFVGGTHGVINGTFLPSQAGYSGWPTTGTAPAQDSQTGLTTLWVENYFGGNGSQYDYSSHTNWPYSGWGWTYATCGHGTWVNANAGNSGDIVAGADCSVVTATSQSVTTLENTPATIVLAGTDSIPANTLVFATSSNPSSGALATTATAGTFAYTPNTGFTGGDSFTFTAGDGSATSTGTVTITINAPAAPSGGGSTPAVTTNNGGGGGIISGPLSVGFVNTNTGGSNGGQVLGAETDTPASCSVYLTGYLKKGSTDSASIKKLQTFLNSNLGISIPVTGVFGPLTEAAVEQFQTKYSDDVLKPWFSQGFSKDMQPSGYVYKTTLREINILQCSSLEIPQPQLP